MTKISFQMELLLIVCGNYILSIPDLKLRMLLLCVGIFFFYERILRSIKYL